MSGKPEPKRNRYRWIPVLISMGLMGFGFAFGQKSDPFTQETLPSRGYQETELNIATPGRYRVSAASETGVSIQVVDAMAGVLGASGTPGEKDGTLDLLFDTGTYLVRTQGLEEIQGQTKLSLKGFVERHTSPVFLPSITIQSDQLGDLQQRTYQITLSEPRVLRLELIGRHLEDARIWYPDGWITPAIPTRTIYEPETGKPMVHLEFHHALPAGRFLLVCYGGPGQAWSVGDSATPLHIRMDPRQWGSEGIHEITVSPFGRESYSVQGSANYFEIHRTKPQTHGFIAQNHG